MTNVLRVVATVTVAVVVVGSVFALPFPDNGFPLAFEVGEGWTGMVESQDETYDAVWESYNGPLTIQMYYSNAPMDREQIVDGFVDSMPGRAEVELFEYSYYDWYLETDIPVPAAEVRVNGTVYLLRADNPDFMGVLTVMSVPLGLADEYLPTMEAVLFPDE